jgi:uncharacterized cupredoxin-like copper-binding protein
MLSLIGITSLLSNTTMVIGIVSVIFVAILAFAGNKWLAMIAIVFTLSVVMHEKDLKGQLAVALAEKKTVEVELQGSQVSMKNLQEAIKTQNAAIDKVKAEGLAREKAHQAEINIAKKKSETYKKQSDDLMKIQVAPGQSACEAADKLLNSEIHNVR